MPVQGKFLRYDKIAVNVIVQNKNGGINSCDIPFSENLGSFIIYYREKIVGGVYDNRFLVKNVKSARILTAEM